MGLLQSLRILRPRLPRPKTFLGVVPLQMGTEFIAAILFFNKLTGVYGLLAILTGFSLSAIQLSAYLYNLAVIILLAICIPHIRRETPLPNLVLAWTYVVDSIINAAYTAAFAVSWYFASTAAAVAAGAVATPLAASSTSVVATTTAAPAMATATPTIANAVPTATPVRLRDVPTATAAAAQASATVFYGGGWMGAHETAASLTLIILVTVVRFYFCLVVMSHTRQALQRYGDHVVESAAAAAGAADDDDDDDDDDDANDGRDGDDDDGQENGGGSKAKSVRHADGDENEDDVVDEEAGLKSGTRSSRGRRHGRRQPSSRQHGSHGGLSSNNPFAQGSPAGDGWKGKVGRALVKVGRTYWLGRQQDDAWTRDVSARFRTGPSRAASSGAEL